MPDSLPAGFEPVSGDNGLPAGFVPVDETNMVDVAGNAFGSLGGGDASGLSPESVRRTASSIESGLGTALDVISPALGMSGKDAAHIALSKETGRAVAETGAATLATLPFGGEGGWVPALMRIGASAAGGAAGSLASESFDPSGAPLKTAGKAALLQAVGQSFGETMTAAIVGTKLAPGGKEAIDALANRGASMTPGQVSQSRLVGTLEAVSEGAFLGGGKIAATRENAKRVATDMLDEFVDSYAKTATKGETGGLLTSALEGAQDWRGEVIGNARAAIDKSLPGPIVDSKPVLDRAYKLLADTDGLPFASPERKAILDVINSLETSVGTVGGKQLVTPRKLTFSEATLFRTQLANAGGVGDAGVMVKGAVESKASVLAQELDSAMKNAAGALNPRARLVFEATNAYYREGAEVFNGEVGRALARRQPETFYNYAVKNAPASGIREVRNLVNNDRIWANIQGQQLSDLLTSVSTAEGTSGVTVSGKRLLNALKPGTELVERLNASFSPAEISELRKVANTLAFAEGTGGAKSLPERLGLRLAQFAPIVGGWQFWTGHPIQSASLVLGPELMARVLTSPTAARALTVGLKTTPGSREAARAFTRFAAEVTRLSSSPSTRHDSAQSIPPSELAPP